MTNVNEFQRESRRIDQLIWDAMSLLEGERALFCGYANDVAWVRRAVEIGVVVTVIENDPTKLDDLQALGVKTLRGSTTLIPARENAFDAAVAFHYLHEIDPTFHAPTISELSRVGKRLIVVEPAPPADKLGKRITELYARAKFEAGSFEEYQPIEYWRKMLSIVKADVVMNQFTFTRIAPRFLIADTVELILDAMAIEDMPQQYLNELRELAQREDAQLNPLSRYVLIAAPQGTDVRTKAGTDFREFDDLAPRRTATPAEPPALAPAAAAAAAVGFAEVLGDAEFPPVLGADGAPLAGTPAYPDPSFDIPTPVAEPAAAIPLPVAPEPLIVPPPPPVPTPLPEPEPEPAFGFGNIGADAGFGFAAPESPFGPGAESPGAPFGTPFALPEDPDPFGLEENPAKRAEQGWSWEPPENPDDDLGGLL